MFSLVVKEKPKTKKTTRGGSHGSDDDEKAVKRLVHYISHRQDEKDALDT